MRLLLLVLLLNPSARAGIPERLKLLLETPLTGLPKFETETPPTVATASLGRLLFYDKRLSVDNTVSCASCHQVEFGYSNNTSFAAGVGGILGSRKAPPILNKAFNAPQFWDGRAETLEEQMTGPLTNPKEMGNTVEKAVTTISGIAGYAPLFEQAFGSREVTIERMARAISDFERTLLSGASRFDKHAADPVTTPFNEEEEIGFALFDDRDCVKCHMAPFFTDNIFHNTGTGFENGVFKDVGRVTVSGDVADTGAFKTPTLRNLSSRAPYMHDGSVATLEDVIEHYNKGGIKNPHLSDKIIPLGLDAGQKKALVAFIKTLDGTGFEETPPTEDEFPR